MSAPVCPRCGDTEIGAWVFAPNTTFHEWCDACMARPYPSVLNPAEVAEELGCTRQHVSKLIRAKQIAAFDIGGGSQRRRWRVPRTEVERFKRGA